MIPSGDFKDYFASRINAPRINRYLISSFSSLIIYGMQNLIVLKLPSKYQFERNLLIHFSPPYDLSHPIVYSFIRAQKKKIQKLIGILITSHASPVINESFFNEFLLARIDALFSSSFQFFVSQVQNGEKPWGSLRNCQCV